MKQVYIILYNECEARLQRIVCEQETSMNDHFQLSTYRVMNVPSPHSVKD